MTTSSHHSALWRLAAEQHYVVTRTQLLEAGITPSGIRHRLKSGRLHQKGRGIYAVGRPVLSQAGEFLVAVLACGPGAALSHESGGLHLRLWSGEADAVHVSIPRGKSHRRPGVTTHRRVLREGDVIEHLGVRVTTPGLTLVDLACRLTPGALEACINEADRRGLVDPETLRRDLDRFAGRRGVGKLRTILDRHTFRLTDSELERLFLPVARRAGLTQPLTGERLNGFRVDFFWPDLGLVVETDGLRYHRTPAQQARDRLRDQAHAAGGLTPLRFTHSQVAYDRAHVRETLAAVAARLERGE